MRHVIYLKITWKCEKRTKWEKCYRKFGVKNKPHTSLLLAKITCTMLKSFTL